MSLKARRDSLLKSSISIKSMRDSVAKFNKGLQQAKKNAFEIVKNTKETPSHCWSSLNLFLSWSWRFLAPNFVLEPDPELFSSNCFW